MNQFITDYDKLIADKKWIKLWAWQQEKGYLHHSEGKIISIGEMIQFCAENKQVVGLDDFTSGEWRVWRTGWKVGERKTYFYHKELTEALWKIVEEILQNE